MIKTGRTILRVLFIGFLVVFAIIKILDTRSDENLVEKRVRHVDNTTSEFDELW